MVFENDHCESFATQFYPGVIPAGLVSSFHGQIWIAGEIDELNEVGGPGVPHPSPFVLA